MYLNYRTCLQIFMGGILICSVLPPSHAVYWLYYNSVPLITPIFSFDTGCHSFGLLLNIHMIYSERVCVSTHICAYVYIHACSWYSAFLPTQLKSLTKWTARCCISFLLSFSTSKLHCGGWTFLMNIHTTQLSRDWIHLTCINPTQRTGMDTLPTHGYGRGWI